MKKTLCCLILSGVLFVSCSNDDTNDVDKANSFQLIDLNTGSKYTSFSNSLTQNNFVKNSNIISTSEFEDSLGKKATMISELINDSLLKVYSKNDDVEFYLEKINENEFYLLDNFRQRAQKVLITINSQNDLKIETIEIYERYTNPNSRDWYGCMKDRLSEPYNIVAVGAASFLGPGGFFSAVGGIGIYCAIK